MCITSAEAHLSKTRILSLPIEEGRHFIAYSNMVTNLSGKPNSMILPIPGKLKKEWFHNTEKYNTFMNDIVEYLTPKTRGTKGLKLSADASFDSFKLGMYYVGIAETFDGIQAFIETLKPEEHPALTESLSTFFREYYKNWGFVVCVFDAAKRMEAQPIAFEYEPFDYSVVFFPTMDAHNGLAPEKGEVDVDHVFIYEDLSRGQVYSPKNTPKFLQNRQYKYLKAHQRMQNGDTYFNAKKLSREFSRNFSGVEFAVEQNNWFE